MSDAKPLGKHAEAFVMIWVSMWPWEWFPVQCSTLTK